MKIRANILHFSHTIIRLAIFLVFIMAAGSVAAENAYFLRGIVRDSISDEPLPYASVMIYGKDRGVVADDRGIFEISVPGGTAALQVGCMGYDRKIVPVKRTQLNMLAVYLSPSSTELQEVVVKKSKYSKKNNPAVEFVKRLKESAESSDPLRNPYYSYDRYERITIGLNDFDTAANSTLLRRMPFLAEHVDTSAVSGKPYLSLLVKEKSSTRHYRKSPRSEREIIAGEKSAGIDEMVDQASMRVFMEDVMREVDLYQNDITLLQNRFVSPLSRIAPDFYKFYLTDTVEVAGERCIVLSFYPHNHSAFGFMGHIYVAADDPKMTPRKVEIHTPREINLNFIDNLFITQTYTTAPDGSRLKTSDNLILEMSVAGKGAMYASRTTGYTGHTFAQVPDSVFTGSATVVQLPGATTRDESFWLQARVGDIGRGESSVATLMQKLRGVPVFYWGEKIVKLLFTGYVNTGSQSKFDFGPVNSVLSFNSLEHVRLRGGGMTTANLSRRWFGRFYVAYGFRDHRWKYSVEAEYSFIDKDYHSREFPVRSLRLTSSYDFERPGQNYMFTTADNIVLSLKRKSDDRAMYLRHNALEFNYETAGHFSVNLAVANERRSVAPTMPLVTADGQAINAFTENVVRLTLRYAPGEKFFQTRTYRIPVNLDAPAVTLMQTYAPKGILGSRFTVNKTDIDLARRWWFSAFGYLDTYAGGGHVWNESPFMLLYTPDVNLSYIIQPRSFALMNPMEFVSTSYAWWDFTYWANGALLNYVPLVKKLKLREVFGFRGYWGCLASSSDPTVHHDLPLMPLGTDMTKLNRGPYMEASVGIENIFKVLRVDYVWRLNYRNVPYAIDRSGVRVALHVTF